MRQETSDVQRNLFSSIDCKVFRPTWICDNGILYKCNNTYVIVGSDGLDPIFGQLDELLVVGGNMVIFIASICKVLYFNSRYHAYSFSVTAQKSAFSSLYDHNVYHAHMLSDGLYITLKHYFMS